jgi:hypothetical protein
MRRTGWSIGAWLARGGREELVLNIFLFIDRFSLPDGTLTTYDTYPERCLPDGRVRAATCLVVCLC